MPVLDGWNMMNGGWNMMNGGWVWMITGSIMFLLFWGTLIWGAIYLLRRPGNGASRPAEDPEAILRRRYARGEIDQQEFEQRLEALRRSRD